MESVVSSILPYNQRKKKILPQHLKVRDFQKKIGIIYRLKQICSFTILNSLFEFSRIFGKFLTTKTLAQLTPSY